MLNFGILKMDKMLRSLEINFCEHLIIYRFKFILLLILNNTAFNSCLCSFAFQ